MRMGLRIVALMGLAGVLVAACSPAGSPSQSNPANPAPAAPAQPKKITAIVQGTLNSVYQPPNLTDRPRGVDELTLMVHSGLSVFDSSGALHPQLSEAVPSVDNGLWT